MRIAVKAKEKEEKVEIVEDANKIEYTLLIEVVEAVRIGNVIVDPGDKIAVIEADKKDDKEDDKKDKKDKKDDKDDKEDDDEKEEKSKKEDVIAKMIKGEPLSEKEKVFLMKII